MIETDKKTFIVEDIIDWESFKDCLTRVYTKVIEEFSDTDENKDVYVFVVCTDCNNHSVTMYFNTLAYLNKIVESYSEKYGDEYTARSLKYSIGDFKFEEYPDELSVFHFPLSDYFSSIPTNTTEECVRFNEIYDAYSEYFINCMIEVVKRLEPVLSRLNRTADFVAYVIDHDAEDEFLYVKETVPEEILKVVFSKFTD